MEKLVPAVFTFVGLSLLCVSFLLRNTDIVSHLASMFILLSGVVLILVGLVTFFLRDEIDFWN
jgi:hypothetical protein